MNRGAKDTAAGFGYCAMRTPKQSRRNGRLRESYPKTGFKEITDDFPETDFWGVSFGELTSHFHRTPFPGTSRASFISAL
jgi:hypothetical protein